MADKDKENKASDSKDDASKKAEGKIGILTWVIVALVVAVLSGSGFFVGRIVASTIAPKPDDAKASEENTEEKTSEADLKSSDDSQDVWYYELESIVVNPDEPGATRFLRVGLNLEMSRELDPNKTKTMIESKKPLLVNWLNLYLKSMSLSEMENEKDLKRIQSQVCDGFNEILFPEAKPQIKNVLIREFNIQ